VSGSSDLLLVAFATAAPVLAALLLARHLPAGQRPSILWFAICGAATGYMALLVEKFGVPSLAQAAPASTAAAFKLSFLVVAPIEEVCKLGIVQHEVSAKRDLAVRSAAMIGLATGAGFAALENYIYVAHAEAGLEGTVIARLLTATPFHMANGVLGGILIWQASRSGKPFALLGALLVIVLLHGAYDAPLFAGGALAAKFAFVLGLTVAIAAGLYRKLPAA
jgi:RsiW-degrading membrane proteinase PrsW (M82 family)